MLNIEEKKMKEKIKFCAFADEASSSLSGQIEALVRNSIDLIEIRGVDGKNVSDLTAGEAKGAKKRLSDGGIGVWSVGSPIGKCDIYDDFSREVERFKRTLETSVILEARNMRIFSFYKTSLCDKDEVIERLYTLAELANGSGVVLCHENEKGIFGESPEQCLMLHKELSMLPAVFDPANFVQCGADTKKAWEMLSPYVKYLHAKDAIGHNVVPCGDGDGNVKYIFEEYQKKDLASKVITLEPHLTSFIGLSALEGEDDTSIVGGIHFSSNDEAFDYAVNSAKGLIN